MTSATKPQPGTKGPKHKPGVPLKLKSRIPTGDETFIGEKYDYWFGVTPDCPYQYITVRGRTFPKFTGSVDFHDDGSPVTPVPNGTVESMTENEAELLLASIDVMAIRFMGSIEPGMGGKMKPRRRGTLIPNTGARNYSPQPSDEPLARYMYLVKYTGENRHAAHPEVLQEE